MSALFCAMHIRSMEIEMDLAGVSNSASVQVRYPLALLLWGHDADELMPAAESGLLEPIKDETAAAFPGALSPWLYCGHLFH
jgi:hypothetical protein